ncbi:fatty acid desaturase [Runella sp. MFBS21]|uniref:fatty acid desaturase n=1 Tax=Runella sp. MFBS21 TaxID=3034018 RepID=UPI0023F9328A|nr:fatty acid desaturase [Runella sp. MFBS21]MDF7817106.1 fatty acid desaturase [Runella sp. MFBS21]
MHSIPVIKPSDIGNRGLWIAFIVLGCWGGSLWFLLHYPLHFNDPLVYLFVLVQMHLYTGVFITAHDAIHGVVSPRYKSLNYWIGFISASLFAFNNFKTLSSKHHLHHKHAATPDDPDYHDGHPHFFLWFIAFAKEYISIGQIVLMAITYNILKLWFPWENLVVFWMIPAVLSTFQLFYFGTYLPHRGEHHNPPLNARSQSLNHLKAFLSCYFFGYHLEHHAYPYLPWWQLPKAREKVEQAMQG